MRVKVSQLTPGCVLLKDVLGKTKRPIIRKNTVLTALHIEVLRKFLIDSVEVSTKLENGKLFIPKELDNMEKELPNTSDENKDITSFENHFYHVVEEYNKQFNSWQNGAQIEIAKVRNVLFPLLERTEDIDREVRFIHKYIDSRNYISFHSVVVSILSSFLARKMGLDKTKWLQVGLAGLLSDTGMAKINPYLLVKKKNKLNVKEMEEIKKHPAYSYRLIENIKSIKNDVKLAVLQHHERADGSGYPLELKLNKIHQFARIIAICDAYLTMIFLEKLLPFQAMEEIYKARILKFDIEIVQVFLKSLVNFSIGSKVKLSNGKIAEIVFMESSHLTRPMVRLVESGEIIVLKNEMKLHIIDWVKE